MLVFKNTTIVEITGIHTGKQPAHNKQDLEGHPFRWGSVSKTMS